MYGYDSKEYRKLDPVQKRFMDAFQSHPAIVGFKKVDVHSQTDVEVMVDVEMGETDAVLDYAYEIADDLNLSIVLPAIGDDYVDFIFTHL